MSKPKGGYSEFIPNAKKKTPTGSLQWVKPHVPDTNLEADGIYQTNIQFQADDPEWVALIEELEEINDAWFASQSAKLGDPDLEQGRVPVKSVKDKDKNVIPGIKELRFTKKAYVKSENPLPGIPVFDTEQKPLTCSIGNGSQGKVAFAVKGYKFGNKLGISLFPRGIRVSELKEFVSQGSEEYDQLFDEDDGEGYSAAAAADTDTSNDDATDY